MDVKRRSFIFCACIVVFQSMYINCQTTSSSNLSDNDLRSMLNTVLEQNRRLLLQNNRLQQVWVGMQQMCTATSMSSCECGQGQGLPNATFTTVEPEVKPDRLHLKVLSVKSGGADLDPTPITVRYMATTDHTTEWIGLRRNGGMWRTAGRRAPERNGSDIYTSTVDVLHLGTMNHVYFRLYNDDESVNMRLNVSELEIPQEQMLRSPSADLVTINSSYIAPGDSDLNITGIVHKSARDFNELAFVEIFFTGLNTSASPPSIFEIMSFNSEGLGLSGGRRTDKTSNMNITLRYPYVQYGGILTVRMPYDDHNSDMVERLFYGPFIKIYSPDGKNVVEKGTMGIFPLEKQTIIFPPSHSVICAAMGNPRPDVSVLKIAKNGKKTEMSTETVIYDSYMNMKVLTLSASQPRQTEGRYVCRATNGNQTIDAPTEVVVLVPAVFDEAKTGLTKNNSEIIVISCKARGNPRPELQLRLYDKYGPDLTKSGMYKVWRSEPNRFTSRVTLTISPVDDRDIHTVFCLAGQGGPNASYEISQRIDVYPGIEKDNNWELYNRIGSAALGP